MKKLIAITILASFLGSTTELHEFLKIPHLLLHFIEHNRESDDISLGEFLHIHYAHDQNHQDEHNDTGCLPFQGNHHLYNFHARIEHTKIFSLVIPAVTPKLHILYKESAHSNYQANIWQPPKIG